MEKEIFEKKLAEIMECFPDKLSREEYLKMAMAALEDGFFLAEFGWHDWEVLDMHAAIKSELGR